MKGELFIPVYKTGYSSSFFIKQRAARHWQHPANTPARLYLIARYQYLCQRRFLNQSNDNFLNFMRLGEGKVLSTGRLNSEFPVV
jgi:hypothetical protein